MEVHHHPHPGPDSHRKKKFKEYFLEFLMLFLAVTLGFFAENMRENISENSKARELAESLYHEVYADSISMQNKVTMRLQKEEQMLYFQKYVLDSNLSELSEQFYPSFAWTGVITTSIIFEPNDGILNQLRNSGSLRYFKSAYLQDCISRISVAILNARDRNSQEYRFIEEFIRPFVLKHYDFKWMDDYTQNGKLSVLEALRQENYHANVKPILRNAADFKRSDAEALIAYYVLIVRATRQLHYTAYIEKNHELLEALRHEYGFRSNEKINNPNRM